MTAINSNKLNSLLAMLTEDVVYYEADGKWRVARDAWNSDLPLPRQ